ncbi:MAG: hypothetical protein ACP5VS_02020 [Desulfomonilaceae bacterium]
MRFCSRILFFVFLAYLGFNAFDCVEPQDFPYLAPEAPEFDGGIPQIRGPSKSQPQSGIGPKLAPVTPEAMKNFGFGPPGEGGEEQVVSNPPGPSNIYSSPPTNLPGRTQKTLKSNMAREPSQVASPTRQNAPVQQPRMVDCSQYPGLIANARSEAEMQITARYYLTCLLQQGWLMENARTQVIQTIEAVTRGNR